MVRLIRSELYSVYRTRTFRWLLIPSMLIIGLILLTVFIEASNNFDTEWSGDAGAAAAFVTAASFSVIISAVYTVSLITGYFRHGTITQTLLIQQNRYKAALASTLTSVIACLTIIVSILLITTLISLPWLAGSEFFSGGTYFKSNGYLLLVVAVISALSAGIGFIIRNQALALTTIFIFLIHGSFFSETGYYKYSFTGVLGGLLTTDPESSSIDVLSRSSSILMLLLYLAVIYSIGLTLFKRRDIN